MFEHRSQPLASRPAFIKRMAAMFGLAMGPVNVLTTNAAKLFASAYAIFSGLMFISVMGVILAPLLHRTIHTFHLDHDRPPRF